MRLPTDPQIGLAVTGCGLFAAVAILCYGIFLAHGGSEFSMHISLGDIVVAASVLIGAVGTWFGMKDDVKALKSWSTKQAQISLQQESRVGKLESIAAAQVALMKAVNARVDRLERHEDAT